jgi:Putative metal-binding motif/SMP-30/Gluconolactonase/LRE-like region
MNKLLVLLLALGLCVWGVGCPADDDDDAVDDDDTGDDDTGDDDTGDDDTGDDDTEYPDEDGDGYGSDVDCNDFNADVYPGAPQICDGVVDNDCDGFIDETETDVDNDGYDECDGDCDDTNAAIFPGAYDVVDGVDNDCDGDLDEDVIDCDNVPTSPLSQTILNGPRGYHGLAIDEFGYIYGSDGSTLIKSDYAGKWSVFTPNMGACEQMTFMPDGDLAVVNSNNNIIQRINPKGVPSLIASTNWIYGLIWGPDDMLYTAGNSQVMRVDPLTGASELVVTVNDAHTVAFNRDATTMYVGTVSGSNLFAVEMDEDLVPTGPPTLIASFGGYLDGIVVDACGYLFITDYSTSAMYRVSPEGDAETFADWQLTGYGHGLIWGTGVGGWREDAVYVPLSYDGNKVKEVVVGIPHMNWGGTVLNGP